MCRFALTPLLAAVLLIGVVAASARSAAVTETIPLKFAKPSDVVAFFTALREKGGVGNAPSPSAVPESVEQMIPNDVDNTLIVRGDAQGVAQVRRLIAFLDVQPRAVRLDLRVLRYTFPANGGAPTVEEIAAPVTQTKNNLAADVAAVGARQTFKLRLTPHVNGDGSVTIAAELGMGGRTSSSVRRLMNGERRLLLGVSDSSDAAVQRWLSRGAAPGTTVSDLPAYSTYFLEVTPTVLTP